MDLSKFIKKKVQIRQQLLDMVYHASKGHIPSSYSIVDFLVYLIYSGIYKAPTLEGSQSDCLVVSKGHAAMALYPIYADLGLFSQNELSKFTTKEGLLRLYADPSIPGVDFVSGSLGNAYGMSAGMAYALRYKSIQANFFTIIGDGECYEGSVWETALFIAHHKLLNHITVIDRNKLSILGDTEEQLAIEPLEKKWKSFGFEVLRINGHSFDELSQLDQFILSNTHSPKCIILDTIKGKGISFMENEPLWHNRMMSEEQYQQACQEISHS